MKDNKIHGETQKNFVNKPFREFVFSVIGPDVKRAREFKEKVLEKYPDAVNQNKFRQDYYSPGTMGIPMERLSAYCEALTVDIDDYAIFCKS